MNDKKYLNVYRMIKGKISRKEYAPNDKLPSKRVMADMCGCSVITVEKAYSMLIDEGYIISKERSGYFVCELDMFFDSTERENITAFEYLKDEESKNTQDFEYSLWFKTIRKVISEKGEKLFVKSPNKGIAPLRNAIADYLLRYRGMIAEPERIIIGSGSEQLYETVVKIMGRDKIYGIENPSYE